MFNSSQHSVSLLQAEMSCYNIFKDEDGYMIKIGDEDINVKTLPECGELINKAIDELKDFIWDKWINISKIAESMVRSHETNQGGKELKYLMCNLKKILNMSSRFSDLSDINLILRGICEVDSSKIGDEDIKHFNILSQQIRVSHHLIMREMYRLKLIEKFSTKVAAISGPWSNVDLEMDERVWEWDDSEEEYFGERQKERRESPRYNYETNSQGYYFWFDDKNREPYNFSDRKWNSPYPISTYFSTP